MVDKRTLFFLIAFLRISVLTSFSFYSYGAATDAVLGSEADQNQEEIVFSEDESLGETPDSVELAAPTVLSDQENGSQEDGLSEAVEQKKSLTEGDLKKKKKKKKPSEAGEEGRKKKKKKKKPSEDGEEGKKRKKKKSSKDGEEGKKKRKKKEKPSEEAFEESLAEEGVVSSDLSSSLEQEKFEGVAISSSGENGASTEENSSSLTSFQEEAHLSSIPGGIENLDQKSEEAPSGNLVKKKKKRSQSKPFDELIEKKQKKKSSDGSVKKKKKKKKKSSDGSVKKKKKKKKSSDGSVKKKKKKKSSDGSVKKKKKFSDDSKKKKKKKHKKKKRKKAFQTKSDARKAFLTFSTNLLKHAGRLSELAENGRMESVLLNLSRKQRGKIEFFLEANRPVLEAIHRYNDLHKISGVEILPDNIYRFIKKNFSLEKLDDRLNIGYSIVRLVGGTYTLKGKEEPQVEEGLLDVLAEEDISTWKPIKFFHRNFIRTLSADKKLAKRVGSTMPLFIQEYYKAMDVETRLELFHNILAIVEKDSSKIDDINLAVKVFQSSGPLLIKMLQELQEEVKGTDTDISEILQGLTEKSPIYMDDKAVTKMVKTRLKDLGETGELRLGGRLGVASIGQAHKVHVGNLKFALKVQKKGVDKLFYREKEFVSKMLDANEKFDKGLKQWIENIWEGIEEELDFRNERRFIREGNELYTNLDEGIQGLSLPNFVLRAKNKDVPSAINTLFMGFAIGKEVGKIMKEGEPDNLIPLYSAMQTLYLRYLKVALGNIDGPNFYHGDLHRGNIYYQKKNNLITMIDFGNAGRVEPYVKEAILNMYRLAEKTNDKTQAVQNHAIKGIGQVLKMFILESLKRKANGEQNIHNNHDKREMISLFFDTIFDEGVSKAERLNAAQRITRKREKLTEEIKKLKEKVENGEASGEDLNSLAIKKDNVDFMKALSCNSFTGYQNSLVKSLVTDDFVSSKLRAVFDELRRNGIAMPKEAIFFNKSNVLLQGILENIRLSLQESGAKFDPVSPDELFYKFLRTL